MAHKGHYGEYTGNARCCKDTKVTASNYEATKKDDEAHMTYLKEDIKYDNKHGHSDKNMTADEKHISKLAGDLKYDNKKFKK